MRPRTKNYAVKTLAGKTTEEKDFMARFGTLYAHNAEACRIAHQISTQLVVEGAKLPGKAGQVPARKLKEEMGKLLELIRNVWDDIIARLDAEAVESVVDKANSQPTKPPQQPLIDFANALVFAASPCDAKRVTANWLGNEVRERTGSCVTLARLEAASGDSNPGRLRRELGIKTVRAKGRKKQ